MEDVLRPQRAALRLLRWLRETDEAAGSAASMHGTVATAIETLAERLGLALAGFHPGARRDGALGWLEPGENLIFLREGLPESVRRFTLAHEIGHAVLHRAGGMAALFDEHPLSTPESLTDTFDGCDDADVTAPADALALSDETLRPGQAYSARAQRESEANAFAATLLLPADKLLAAYLDEDNPQRSWRLTPRALAERFGVSEDAVLRRLAALLVPAAGEVDRAPAAAEHAGSMQGAGRTAALDPWQRRAAEARTPALIVAGPGTGKTSTLVGRVVHLVREQGVPADGILALTFSNKAAREMRERLQAVLTVTQDDGETGDRFELPPLPSISTVHAFCGDLLRRYAPLVGLRPDFRLVGATDGYFLLRRLAGQLALSHYQPLAQPGLHFPTLLAAISRAKDELADPERYAAVAQAMTERAATPEERHEAERATEVAVVYGSYQAALAERGDPDFGDIIRLTVRLLREQPDVLAEVRTRYRHVLVDEFQDINRAMGVLLQTLTAFDGALWAVGDADQAIYRFRGASPANLSRFTSDYPTAQVQTLQRNYRSTASILEAAAAVGGTFLDGHTDASQRPALTAVRQSDSDAEASITLASAPNEAAELGRLAEAIRERQAQGRRLGDQVVLCRTRRHCQQVAATLNDNGIATRLALPLLEQDEVKDVLAVLSLLSDVSGAGILRAGNVADHAYTRADARAVLAQAQTRRLPTGTYLLLLAREGTEVEGVTPAGRRGLNALAAILAELRLAPDVATGLCRYIFGLTQIGRRLLASQAIADPETDGDADRLRQRAASLAQLLTHARAFEEQRRLADLAQFDGTDAALPRAAADWGAFLEYLRVVLATRQEGGNAAEELMGDSDARVRVMTVHASKGLEFPVVYLPGLADRRFPMQRRGISAPMPADLSEDETLEAQNPNAHLAEEACLFYVALTRARDELVLSYAEQYGRMRYRPSPFLTPIQQRLGSRLRQIHWTAVPASSSIPLGATIADGGAAQHLDEEETPLALWEGPLRPSAIETYSRCPRQYAYRYVYGLRPREVGLVTLRRTLHDTLHTLQERVAQVAAQVHVGQTAEMVPQSPTLDEALNIFEQQWEAMLERERRTATNAAEDVTVATDTLPADGATQANVEWMPPLSQPFVEVYRRHGRQIIERSWARMVQRQLPGMEDVSDAADEDVSAAPPEARYDHPVVVRVGEREIAVTLDRVEGSARSSQSYPGNNRSGSGRMTTQGKQSGAQQADAQPVRFVRHKLGSPRAAQADLRALFYALAAEQKVFGSPAEVYDHNLTTGEMERVTLNPRKIAKLREDLDELLEGINSGIYPARPDPNMCLNCPFLFICPA